MIKNIKESLNQLRIRVLSDFYAAGSAAAGGVPDYPDDGHFVYV